MGPRQPDAPGSAAGGVRRGVVAGAPEPRPGVRQRQPDADRRSRTGLARGVPPDHARAPVPAAGPPRQRCQPGRPAGHQHQRRQTAALRRHAGPAAGHPGGAAGGRPAALRRPGGEKRRRLRHVQAVHWLTGRLRGGDGGDVPPGDAAGGGTPAGCRVPGDGAGHGGRSRGAPRRAVAIRRRRGFTPRLGGRPSGGAAIGARGPVGTPGRIARIVAAPDRRG